MGKWKDCLISDLGTVVGGATPSTKDQDNFNYGTIPWITPKDLSSFSGRYISHGERNITQKGLDSCSTQLLPANSVLFSSRAPIGYVAISECPVCTNQGFKSVIPKEDTDPLFLFYLLKYRKNYIEAMGSGTTFKEVSGKTMASIPVHVPVEKEEQKMIGHFLGSLDDKIELNNQINGNLQQLAFELFGKLMSAPQESKCRLNSIAILNPKRTLPRNKSARCIEMSKLSTSCSFPADWVYKVYNGGTTFKNGDTLMARITPCLENGKAGFVNFLDEREIAFGSTEYIVISTKGNISPEFFYCLVRSPNFVDYAKKNMNGSSGRQRVSAEVIGKYELPALTTEKLSEFNTIVPSIFKKIRDNSVENMKLAQMRDCLLPKLMSGEIDVSDIDL